MSFIFADSAGGGGGGAVSSVNGQTGVVVLTKSDIGLDQVDNTSDLAKPISTATQAALDAKMTRTVYDTQNLGTDVYNYAVAMAIALG